MIVILECFSPVVSQYCLAQTKMNIKFGNNNNIRSELEFYLSVVVLWKEIEEIFVSLRNERRLTIARDQSAEAKFEPKNVYTTLFSILTLIR